MSSLKALGGDPTCNDCCGNYVRLGKPCEYHVPTGATPGEKSGVFHEWFLRHALDSMYGWSKIKRFFPKTCRTYQDYVDGIERLKKAVDAAVTEECKGMAAPVDDSPYV